MCARRIRAARAPGLILDGVAQLALISGIVAHPQIESVASFTSPLTLVAGKHHPRAVIRHRRRSSNPAADALAETLRKVLPGLGGEVVVH